MNSAYKKDLHAVLGVDEQAGPEVLRKAYLALAVKYHPDRNPGDREAEERFKEISQAYAILSDPAAKARYERLRPKKTGPAGSSAGTARSGGASARPESGPRPAGGNGSSAGAGSSGAGASAGTDNSARAGETDFDEVLASFFKTAKGRETLRDLEGELNKAGIKFKVEDFAEWFKKQQPAAASEPAGSFWERLGSWLPGAASRARKKERQYEVQYQISLTSQAAAAGTTVEITYQRDERSIQGAHHLKVKIPAGTKNGDRLRLAGQGRQKPDQSRGDLILTVLVGQRQSIDDLFRQNG